MGSYYSHNYGFHPRIKSSPRRCLDSLISDAIVTRCRSVVRALPEADQSPVVCLLNPDFPARWYWVVLPGNEYQPLEDIMRIKAAVLRLLFS